MELTCTQLVELVTDYLEGALGEHDVRAFDAHLGHCPGCTEYLEQMRTTISLVGTLTPNDLTEAAQTALLQAFRGWKRS